MAAVLRHATRRLVGLKRTHAAAIAEERRRLLPRLIHTDERARMLREIEGKKEEMYDLIAETENGVHTDQENRFLLMILSAHVHQSQADNPRWCWLRESKRRIAVLKPVAVATGFITSAVCLLVLSVMDDLRVEEAARRKEKRQADAAAGEKEGRLAPVGADARARELELLAEEINYLCAEQQRLQGKLDEAGYLTSSGRSR